MVISNVIVGICCVLAFGAIVWAVVNEFRPESKAKTNESSEKKDGAVANRE